MTHRIFSSSGVDDATTTVDDDVIVPAHILRMIINNHFDDEVYLPRLARLFKLTAPETRIALFAPFLLLPLAAKTDSKLMSRVAQVHVILDLLGVACDDDARYSDVVVKFIGENSEGIWESLTAHVESLSVERSLYKRLSETMLLMVLHHAKPLLLLPRLVSQFETIQSQDRTCMKNFYYIYLLCVSCFFLCSL